MDSKLVGLEEGADDYLTKPFNVRELEIRIENLLASRQRLKASLISAESLSGDGAVPQSAVAPTRSSFVGRVREVIATRLSDEEFSVDALAAALGVGRTTLYSRLAEALDTSPMDLIWRMRLERAASMLRAGSGNVSEIAYGVGFKSVGHFCRRFRQEYDCSPTEYADRPESAAH
jgi:AraC-like DNA-binding protein